MTALALTLMMFAAPAQTPPAAAPAASASKKASEAKTPPTAAADRQTTAKDAAPAKGKTEPERNCFPELAEKRVFFTGGWIGDTQCIWKAEKDSVVRQVCRVYYQMDGHCVEAGK